MSDDADRAGELQEYYSEDRLRIARANFDKIKPGVAGECAICDTQSLRLVEVVYRKEKTLACAKCRDHFKLG